MALSFASSEIIALCLESILYGIYVVLFAGCVKVLFSKRRRRAGGNYRLIIVSSVLFVLITWHQIADAVRLYISYHENNQTSQGPDIYFINVKATLSIMKTSVYLAETVVSDLFILYRCYIVWNANSLVIAVPVLLYLADIGTGIAAVYTLTLVGANPVFNLEQERITNAFFSCTLALNAVCTGLIAFRIWRTQRQTRDAKMGSNLIHVSVIVVESGAIYLSVLACSLLFNIFLDIFSLIIVRVGLGISSEETRRTVQSISFSMPSKTSAGQSTRSNGPIVFRSTTTTQFTDGAGSESTFKANESQASFKMELRSDVESSISN
ncbi:hypothetical protein B0F90DRAFT_1731074 [Multifurca ochricompacta]|uniref:Uncharacterized protein n=1 Tax=Multifurca ochricompacta TaxID=376703 RepID=A0AAD4M433_9AGAM|nr:hypothetical protein B0F90DRAFT_1731074 [Multifurca ochricompacta]